VNIYKYGLRFAGKRTLVREDERNKKESTKHEQEESDNLEK
jgi:hypothetical protein